MFKIFLSHSSKDKSIVKRLANDLELEGYDVWLDEWQIKVGDCIVNKIETGLSDSEYVIVVLSKNSVNSGWVDREWKAKYWDEIEQHRRLVLPILIDDCKIPTLLKTKKYADFRQDYITGFNNLKNSLFPILPREVIVERYSKMNAIISHELRTVATQLKGFTSMLVADPTNKKFLENFWKHVPKAIDRLQIFLNSLLVFGNELIIKPSLEDVNELINIIIKYSFSMKDGITFTKKLNKLPQTNLDRHLFMKAVENIIINSIEAMPNGGEIIISTNVDRIYEQEYIVIKITDFGFGINEFVGTRIFDPFFTTKKERNAYGVGLTEAKYIIEEHRGYLKFESKKDIGSSFYLMLPISMKEYDAETND